jgi:hypothetical protein
MTPRSPLQPPACRAIRAVVLWAAVGCGATSLPQSARPAWRTVRYAPLAMAADVRQPGQLVVLGTDERDGSTIVAVPVAPRAIVVDALVLSADGGAVSIAVSLEAWPIVPAPPVARAATSIPGDPSDPARGAVPAPAPAARSSAVAPARSSAARIAALVVGRDLADLALVAQPAGPAEDPAAAAAIAAGWIAAITGAPIDPRAALVGAVLPGGTLGPVDAIPERWLAAIARGKTRLGYPAGMRFAPPRAPGPPIDLLRLARDHHAEAIELADVRDAYRLLTGSALPAVVPVSEPELALDADTTATLTARYTAAQRRLAGEWVAVLELDQAGRLPAAIRHHAQRAQQRSRDAEARRRAGNLAAACHLIEAAWLEAAAANATHQVILKLRAGDLAGAASAVAGLDPSDAELVARLGRLGARTPSTLAGQLATLAGLDAALTGWATHVVAASAVGASVAVVTGLASRPRAPPATLDAVADAVAAAARLMFRVVAATQGADPELAGEAGVGYAAVPGQLARVAGAAQAAAAASLRELDAAAVAPLAQRRGITTLEARRQLAITAPRLLVADVLASDASGRAVAPVTTPAGEASLAASLRALAAAELTVRGAAEAAVHASLAVQRDATGRITALAHAGALRHLLASSARAARASARASRIASGAIPVAARLAYQVAIAMAAGDLDDQVGALAELWAASAWCELAVILARNAGSPATPSTSRAP